MDDKFFSQKVRRPLAATFRTWHTYITKKYCRRYFIGLLLN